MLEQLIVRNFQIHGKRIIDLSPTVNVFVGPSDRGKSAFLRALRWICLNKPQGETFVREGAEHCYGKLRVDGHEVLRERGPGLNSYSLDGHRYQAFGHDVPPEIASLLNVSELNFARQHDAPFWLSLSPGQVSRELNAVVDLEVIDSALSNIASEVRQASSEVEVSEKRLARAREERDQLAWVKEASDNLGKIGKIYEDLTATLLKRSRIDGLVHNGGRAALEIDRLALGLVGGKKSARKGEEALRKREEVENLRSLLAVHSSTEEERCLLERSLEAVRQELKGLLKGMKVCPLCGTETPSPPRS